ncbi:MAG: amino acid permease, partial [Mycoplasmatales bacterium]
MGKKKISVMTLSMLMFMAVFGITNIANNYAAFGNSAIGWFILVALFFIPLALIMSEMATHKLCENDNSGISAWIKIGLGESWGFIGAWCFFVANIFYLPMLASRVPVFLSWVFKAEFDSLSEVVSKGGEVTGVVTASSDPIYFLTISFITVIIAIVAAIFIEKIFEFLGRYIGYVSLIITFVFILLAILAVPLLKDVFVANPITFDNIEITGIIPSFSASSLSTFAWVLFAVAGIETVGSYVGRIENPAKKIPKGIILAASVVVFAYILGFIGMSFILTPDQVPNTSMENLLPIIYAQAGALWGFGTWFLRITMLLFAVITMTALVLWMTAT